MRCASITVGIVDYVDAYYRDSERRLRYAVEDAASFHRYVTLAWPKDADRFHHLLTDAQAGLGHLEATFETVAALGRLDLFILYLSGHGDRGLQGDGWFCLSEAQPGASSLDSAALDRLLAKLDTESLLVCLDCCHAEAVVSRCRSFSMAEGRRARILAASCRADQRSWEDDSLKRSLFSDILIRALSTDSPIADPQGQVDIEGRLLPHLRDQVPIAASALKRGHEQVPVTACISSGSLSVPVISSASLGRPLTIAQAIRAGVRRFVATILVTAFAGLLVTELLMFHVVVDSTGEILVRPGLSSTYNIVPFHLVGDLDTGISINDISPGEGGLTADLANGSLWGFATHRDMQGLRPWLAALHPILNSKRMAETDAFVYASPPKLNVDNDPPPTLTALFLASLQERSVSDLGRSLYPYDPDLPWACTDAISNQLDFTRLLAPPEVFARDTEWIAATAPQEPVARAAQLTKLIKIASYRAFHEADDDKRRLEFDAFAAAVEQLVPGGETKEFADAAQPFFESAKGTWCGLYASFAAAIGGDEPQSAAGEAGLRAMFESYDRSKEGDVGSADQQIAVAGLERLAAKRALDPATIVAIGAMIKRDGGDLSAPTPATDLLSAIAPSQKLGNDLHALIAQHLHASTGPGDFSAVAAIRILARNISFLDADQKALLERWLAAEVKADPLLEDVHEAIGFAARGRPVPDDQLRLLEDQLTWASRLSPEAVNYRGESVIRRSGDAAAVALGRVAQKEVLRDDITMRIANLVASRTDLDGRDEILRGLAHQWLSEVPDLAAAIEERLAGSSDSAARRALNVEVASLAVAALPRSDRAEVTQRLLAAWRKEIEPTQRTALATLLGLIALRTGSDASTPATTQPQKN
ncbi:hypothetical protein EN866_33210 [Mesorhizobium sp. M2D.F.Ca.ET.223.01.1.1]|uniref:caspase family protein n=1 Tax=Mesorhizobium sp. M2D.F.Ca.ET.223.01.1.1 TaxID=2563940 RepID=UPI0010920582|nr:caspase family protein [Mesorhizobium sp. M2D.F.Ca.ET.223.01.1.1]TGR84548.1 hypothetical protein EN866_33210 [Mesorhizobium sp. M2D.F.Ca.ET.223.01.1.1]TGT78428.1 hypothetical protein EN802_01945 [bacterium M00.F.Ca.ET.159.01.1.1]TGT89096.1 hypothetical protein EN800_01950 [bacterium M00.F.Ca.ET.157.01.1.1]